MKIMLLVIIVIYLIGFVFNLITIPIEKIYSKKIRKIKVKKHKNIYVLLPALKEQKIVSETINWFKEIKYSGKIKFIIITSQKEEEYYKENKINEKTTNELVEIELKKVKDNRFIHLHYPMTNGNKSSQLNYAVDEILKLENDLENTYISVFDFDSKPDLNTFDKLNKVAEYKNNPDVINQVPMCFENYEAFSKNRNKLLVLLYSFQQTVRACAIEKMKLLVCSMTSLKIPQYCMGACMHIKLTTLVENDNFPIFVDDLTLGYRLSIKGCKFCYLPASNYTLIPNKIFDYVNSSVLIFKGVSTYLSEIKRAKGRNLWGRFKLFVEGTINLLAFIVIPIIFVISYIYYFVISVINKKVSIMLILLLSIPYLYSISSYINLKNEGFKNDNKINSFLAILISPVWYIFRPLGFFVYFYRVIKSKINGGQVQYRKTER